MRIIRARCCGRLDIETCPGCPVWHAREEAIRRVGAHANPYWTIEALRSAAKVARRNLEFSSDHIWWDLEERGVDPPHEPRAMGQITRIMVSREQAVFDHKGKSMRSVRHGGDVSFYRSKIYVVPGMRVVS